MPNAAPVTAMQPQCLTPAQWPLLEALFQDVFGHPLQRTLTAWKYGPGRGLSIGLLDEGGQRLAAHCGLVFREVQAEGRTLQAAQFADLMVAPSHRGMLLRARSPFAQVVGHAMSLLGGDLNPGNDLGLTFGFPSGRAMRLAEHLGLVHEVDQVFEIDWLPAPGPLPEPVHADSPGIAEEIDSLWACMRHDLADARVGSRAAAWFVPRYLQHPTHTYRLHRVVTGGDGAVACIATRQEGDRLVLTDWVCALQHLPAMVAGARAVAAHAGLPVLSTWITSGYAGSLSPGSARCQPTEFRIIGRGRRPTGEHQRLHGRWWLTAGDTDYR